MPETTEYPHAKPAEPKEACRSLTVNRNLPTNAGGRARARGGILDRFVEGSNGTETLNNYKAPFTYPSNHMIVSFKYFYRSLEWYGNFAITLAIHRAPISETP